MSWTCPQCGHENDESRRECAACSFINFPPAVTLTGATGKPLRMTIDTSVDRHLLRRAVGDEFIYASEPQYRIYKDRVLGGWAIQHDPGATHPTFYNGSPLGAEPRLIEEGAAISVGPDKARVTVSLK